MDADHAEVSAEAQRRIHTARVRDAAFRIKQIARGLSDDDAETLADVLLAASEQGSKVTRPLIEKELEARGRSSHAIERILKLFPI